MYMESERDRERYKAGERKRGREGERARGRQRERENMKDSPSAMA